MSLIKALSEEGGDGNLNGSEEERNENDVAGGEEKAYENAYI